MDAWEDLYGQRQLGKYGSPVGASVPKAEKFMKTHEEHSVDIVHIPVLPSVIMDIILWHCDLWSIEHGGLEKGNKDQETDYFATVNDVPRSCRSKYLHYPYFPSSSIAHQYSLF